MAVTVAAAGSALAIYLLGRRGGGGACGADGLLEPAETHQAVSYAPTGESFLEELYFLAEGLR